MKKIFTLLAAVLTAGSIFAQAQRLVLFEDLSGENCTPCAIINPYVYTLVDMYPSQVILIKYQVPIPTAGTLYYQDETDVNSRINYYGDDYAPWGEQDGVLWDSSLLTSDPSDAYSPYTWAANGAGQPNPGYLDAESAIPSPFTIDVSQVITGLTDSFYATVVVTAPAAFTGGSDMKLRVALVENLQFAIPIGKNGETQYQNVMDKMYPNYEGTTLDAFWSAGQSKTFTFAGKLPSYVRDKSQLRFVAFVQDDATKHVLQAGVSAYTVFAADAAANEIVNLYSNCGTQVQPFFSFTNVGSQTLTSCYFDVSVDGTVVDSVYWDGTSSPLATDDSTETELNTITITTPGSHVLSVTISSPNGQVDQNPLNNTATMNIDVSPTAVSVPLVQGFESGLPSDWAVEYYFHDSAWQVEHVGDTSSYSCMADFYDDLGSELHYGSVMSLYPPAFSLYNAKHATVKFNHAYSPYYFGVDDGEDVFSDDSLYVDVSTDCGNSWNTVWGNGFQGLWTVTADQVNDQVAFVPTSSEWASDSADISIAAENNDVLLRFRAVYGEGNDLYIDNVNIYGYDFFTPAGIRAVAGNDFMNVYPNPASNVLNLNLTLDGASRISYSITDLNGQIIRGDEVNANAGQNIFSINTASFASGTYLMTVSRNGEQTTKLFAITH